MSTEISPMPEPGKPNEHDQRKQRSRMAAMLSWLQRIRENLDAHMFFWIISGITLYVFFGVPQITNIWQQLPPVSWWLAAYAVFIVILLSFYAGSVFVVLFSPLSSDSDKNEKPASPSGIWRQLGEFVPACAAGSLLYLAQRFESVDLPAPLGVRLRRLDKQLWCFWSIGLVLVIVGGFAIVGGADSGSCIGYPLSGAFCSGLGLILLSIGLWLFCRPFTPPLIPRTPTASWYFGRLLSWVFWTTCAGELLWFLASTDSQGAIVSYRLYTIWAVAQALTFAILIGLLIDRLNGLYRQWPVRLVALFGLVLSFWLATRCESLAPDDADRFIRGKGEAAGAAKVVPSPNERNQRWFQQLKIRLDAIPVNEGPVILVAASGGGSRAAIFTVLTLETLARTPVDPNLPLQLSTSERTKVRTWADNAIVMSSVSGGSLATAYFVHRLTPLAEDSKLGRSCDPTAVKDLRNTTKSELIAALVNLADNQLRDLLDMQAVTNPMGNKELKNQLEQKNGASEALTAVKLRDGFRQMAKRRDELWLERVHLAERNEPMPMKDQAELDALENVTASVHADLFVRNLANLDIKTALNQDERDTADWVLKSKAFDEMCLDFMAPIMRGVLSPTFGRGDALAFAWTDRFDWYNSTNFSGYAEPKDPAGPGNYHAPRFADHHPLVLFNTCDVNRGSRVVVGFPSVPDDLWKKDDEDTKATRSRLRSLNEHDPHFRVSLARAVRLSSNFPFGFRLSEVQIKDGKRVHMVDGGVVDNTGLDTIREVFRALSDHAKQGENSPYSENAASILKGLRQRGVIILEIDAGSKPCERTPNWLDPFGGPSEQIDALTNAAYTNADLVKAFYVNEIRSILKQNLSALADLGQDSNASLAPFVDRLPNSTLHVSFQCNHYLQGQASHGEEVMTAWALGPKDKAQVVHRFLIELAQWDRRRKDACLDVRRGSESYLRIENAARTKVLLDLLSILNEGYKKLLTDMDLAKVKTNENLFLEKIKALSSEFRRLNEIAKNFPDVQLDRPLMELIRTKSAVEQQLATSLDPKSDPTVVAFQKWQRLSAPPLLGGISDNTEILQTQTNAVINLRKELQRIHDPQAKYDKTASRAKALFEKRSK